MITLNEYHKLHHKHIYEGYCDQVPQQIADLSKLLQNRVNLSIMEIGFNGGHSSDLFLKTEPSCTVTAFDIGNHDYVNVGKSYIDMTYPNRHTLIIGDSRHTLPQYIKENPNKKFDIIFIDGGHDLEVAESDLCNCIQLCHSNTILIMDDTIMTNLNLHQRWNTGPTLAWLRAVSNGKIVSINSYDYNVGRGMSVGMIR